MEILQREGVEIEWGGDFGGEDETVLASQYDRPVMITHFPTAIKAFYMEPTPGDPKTVLGLDVIAPEGYGEIIGGSHSASTTTTCCCLASMSTSCRVEAFQWYLDVRKYGAFPHSGFGMGIERFVAWMCGVKHLRETIPYPRMLYQDLPVSSSAGRPDEPPRRLRIYAALAVLVLIWGTTWAVIRVGLRGIPPFTGISLRFAMAAALLFI